MPKVDRETLRKVEAAQERFVREVDDHPMLSPTTKWTYKRGASDFVRWLNDEFVPGRKLKR